MNTSSKVGRAAKKTAPTQPSPDPLAKLSPAVRLAAMLVEEMESCELDARLVDVASCRVALDFTTIRPEHRDGDSLASMVIGHLLVVHRRPLLTELRVMMVETAAKRAYDRWRPTVAG